MVSRPVRWQPLLARTSPLAPALSFHYPLLCVIPRACDFFDLSYFSHPYQTCFTPQQNRHPERSASQIYHVTKDLRREVEGPRRCLPADAVRSFLTTKLKSHKLRAQRGICSSLQQQPMWDGNAAPFFVIPPAPACCGTEAKGPAVLRTLRGNVSRQTAAAAVLRHRSNPPGCVPPSPAPALAIETQITSADKQTRMREK